MNERLKKLRKNLGLTMEAFGSQIGVKKNTVSQWESGTNSLTEQMLKAICNVNWDGKRVNENWLRGNSDQMFRNDTNSELDALAEKYKLSDMEYTFLKEYFKIPSARREIFFETLDMIFSAVHEGEPAASDPVPPNVPDHREANLDDLSDEEIGKLYRQSKKIEKEVAEKSEVS